MKGLVFDDGPGGADFHAGGALDAFVGYFKCGPGCLDGSAGTLFPAHPAGDACVL
jgi:hypothetical protein